jgi:hypothetical protein
MKKQMRIIWLFVLLAIIILGGFMIGTSSGLYEYMGNNLHPVYVSVVAQNGITGPLYKNGYYV